MRMKAFGANLPSVVSGACSGSFAARTGREKARVNPAANPPLSRARRDGTCAMFSDPCIAASLDFARGAFDRFADTDIGAAAADIPGHRCVDIGVVGLRRSGEQSCRRHDLAGLAIAALDDFEIEPGFLHFGAGLAGADALDRGDGLGADRTDGQQARAHRIAVDMNRACAALRDAAAEFRAGHAEYVAQHPEQRRVLGSVESYTSTIDRQSSHASLPPHLPREGVPAKKALP